MDQADVLLYQNWETVERALRAINGVPPSVDADVQRSDSLLDAHGAAFRRQHIMLSSFNDARLRALVDRPLPASCATIRLREVNGAAPRKVVSRAVSSHIVHTFRGVRCAAPASSLDARVNAFKDKVLPPLRRRSAPIGRRAFTHILRVLPRVPGVSGGPREQGADFVSIHEYSRDSEGVARPVAVFSGPRAAFIIFGAGALAGAPHPRREQLRLRLAAGPRPLLLELLSSRARRRGEARRRRLCLYTRFDALALARVLGDARGAVLFEDGCARGRRGPRLPVGSSRELCFIYIQVLVTRSLFRGKDGTNE